MITFRRLLMLAAAAGLAAAGWWLGPRRVAVVDTADGRHEWVGGQAPPRREIVWQPAEPVPDPAGSAKDSLVSPQIADQGRTLYFTRRGTDGRAHIWLSRAGADGRLAPEPAAELNSAADDVGPSISRDGRELYLYSNRAGGLGGFDLYVSYRTPTGWSRPQNLGPQVNSAADEYDPAPSPDGKRLFFASNRASQPAGAGAPAWSTTLRAHLGRAGPARFDLYVASRERPGAEWRAPEAPAGLNRPDSHQGAPHVSPDGAFLYFASDRPVRAGEARNLDIFRARILPAGFGEPENLGPGINTSANETEPALSAEGFALMFSRNQDGGPSYGLFRSTAAEVIRRDEWDAGPAAAALAGIWWQALLVLLSFAATLGLIWRLRQWLFEKASAGRFVAASLLIHALVLLSIWSIPVAEQVIRRIDTALGGRPEMTISAAAAGRRDGNPAPAGFGAAAELSAPAPAAVNAERPNVEAEPAPVALDRPMAPPAAPTIKALPERMTLPVPQAPPDSSPVRNPAALARVVRLPVAAGVQLIEAEAPRAVQRPAEAQAAAARVEASRPTPAAEPVAAPRAEAAKPAVPGVTAVEVRLPAAKPAEPAVGITAPDARLLPAPRTTTAARVADATVAEAAAPAAAVRSAGEAPLAPTEARAERPQSSTPGTPAAAPAGAETRLPPVRPAATSTEPAAAVDRSTAAGPIVAAVDVRLPSAVRRPAARGVAEVIDADVPAASPTPVKPATAEPGDAPATATVGRSAGADTSAAPASVNSAAGAPPAVALPRATPGAGRVVPAAASADDGPRIASAAGLPGRTMRRIGAAETVEDGAALEAAFVLRKPEVRKAAVEKAGGTEASETAVERGLDWIAARQRPDGRWSLRGGFADGGTVDSDCAATGLALLPMLGAGNTDKTGRHRAAVARGLKWLIDRQRPDGDLFGDGPAKAHMYSHAIAAIALCEAYGMTRDPEFRRPAQRALDFIVASQNAELGGWRYTPGTDSDTSVLGWQVQALKSGAIAGLAVPDRTWAGVRKWLASVEAEGRPGRFGYHSRAPTSAMTAQGLLCLQLMGAGRDDARIRAGAPALADSLPGRGDTSYCWYYATQVCYHIGGDQWKRWNAAMLEHLIGTQSIKGALSGSWTPQDARETPGGRLYATSLRLLMLEVYYRHLPLYKQLGE